MYAAFLVVALGRLKGLTTSGKMKSGEGGRRGGEEGKGSDKGMGGEQFLEQAGVCCVPGSGFGQVEGTYHFR